MDLLNSDRTPFVDNSLFLSPALYDTNRTELCGIFKPNVMWFEFFKYSTIAIEVTSKPTCMNQITL